MPPLNPRAPRNRIADQCLIHSLMRGDEIQKRGMYPHRVPEMPGYEVFPDPNEVCYCWWIREYERRSYSQRN